MKLCITNSNGEILTGWGEDKQTPTFEKGGEPYIYEDMDDVEFDIIWLSANKGIKATGRAIGQNILVL